MNPMNEQETAAQLHAAFTRLIEGEAEPHDESLIAEHLKSHPESIALLRKQLEVDALLQLEADPAPAAFVESVLSQTLPPAHAEVFVKRVSSAISKSVTKTHPHTSFRRSWLSWRPIAAAATGLLSGMLCTSVVFGYLAPGTRKSLGVFETSFEESPALKALGVPKKPGEWGGDFAEIVGPQNGVSPHVGVKMWRFLRADNAVDARGPVNYVGEAIRIVDLKHLIGAKIKAGTQIEVGAWFAQGHTSPEAQRHWVVKAAAFEGDVSDAPALWLKWDESSASLVQREVPATQTGRWEWVSAMMVLPENADFLVFECGVVQRQPALSEGVAEFPAQYVDDVRVRVLLPSGDTPIRD
jgi:hypothetical protein